MKERPLHIWAGNCGDISISALTGGTTSHCVGEEQRTNFPPPPGLARRDRCHDRAAVTPPIKGQIIVSTAQR